MHIPENARKLVVPPSRPRTHPPCRTCLLLNVSHTDLCWAPCGGRAFRPYSRCMLKYQLINGFFMLISQARDGRPNSAANPLPTPINSAAGGLGQIVSKLLVLLY